MYWLNSNRMRLVVVGIVAAIVFGGGRAKADFTFGEPVNLGPTVNSQLDDVDPFLSAGGLELYFCSNRPGGYGRDDIWVTKRTTTYNEWNPPENLGPTVNGPDSNCLPRLSADGLELYFDSGRPGGEGSWDAWVTKRATKDSAWGIPENFGPPVNTSFADGTVWITNDGLELYFSSSRSGGYGASDLYVSTRTTTYDDWGPAVNLGPIVNGLSSDLVTCVSADALALFFAEELSGRIRNGGFGGVDIWVTMRANRSSPWGTPVNLGPIINTLFNDGSANFSPEDSTLYFYSNRPGGLGLTDIWQAPIIPIVDLNADGIVDSADMCIVVDHWGTDEPLCDIGPMPWGDGIVDVQDLIVLAEHLFEEPTLVAHWPLDEAQGDIAYDNTGTCDGTLLGAPVWQPTGGMVDGALQFDGVDDCIVTNSIPNSIKGPFSVFAWVKGGAPGQVVLSRIGGVNWLCTDPLEANLMTELKASGRGATELLSQIIITDGNWHRIGFVWDGSHRTLYVDDVEVANDAQDGLEPATGGFYIGTGKAMQPGTYWSGLIDDVRIYNRAVKP